MADYAKLSLKLISSETSDYSDPYVEHEALLTFSPTECESHKLAISNAAASTIYTDKYTAISLVMIENLDATNYVTVTWTNAVPAAIAHRIPAGQVFLIQDLTEASNFTMQANTAPCNVRYTIVGT